MACLWFPPFHVTAWNIALPLDFHRVAIVLGGESSFYFITHTFTKWTQVLKAFFPLVKGKTTLVGIKGKATVLSLTWLRPVQRYIWAERIRLSQHKSTFDVQNIRPSPAPLWRLNLFPVQYVWLSYPRLNSIPFLTFESFLFISHDITYSVCLCSPALSSLHERSLCHAALPSLDWWGWFFYFIIPLPWLSGGVKPVKDQNFTLFLVNCRARL